jgi:hypothetical protein
MNGAWRAGDDLRDRGTHMRGCSIIAGKTPGQGAKKVTVLVAAENLEPGQALFAQAAAVAPQGAFLRDGSHARPPPYIRKQNRSRESCDNNDNND